MFEANMHLRAEFLDFASTLSTTSHFTRLSLSSLISFFSLVCSHQHRIAEMRNQKLEQILTGFRRDSFVYRIVAAMGHGSTLKLAQLSCILFAVFIVFSASGWSQDENYSSRKTVFKMFRVNFTHGGACLWCATIYKLHVCVCVSVGV